MLLHITPSTEAVIRQYRVIVHRIAYGAAKAN